MSIHPRRAATTRGTTAIAVAVGAWLAVVAGSLASDVVAAGQSSTTGQPSAAGSSPVAVQSPTAAPSPAGAVVNRYCVTCHSERGRAGGLVLAGVDSAHPANNPEIWEKVVTKLRAGAMPPPGAPRPDQPTINAAATWLEADLDRAWSAHPNPGRTSAVHRLNRSEYANAIRDLFALDFDARPLLPGDDTADGSFDNLADVLTISTAHLERYLSVARQVTRLAVGLPPAAPGLQTYEIPLHIVQDDRQSEDLPFGSRGGLATRHVFPADGEYLIKVRLRRQYQDYVMGMGWPQQLDVRLDGKLLKRFTVGGQAPGRPAAASYAGDGEPGFAGAPEWETYMQLTADAGLEVRVPVTAGPHVVGVSFVREMFAPEGLPQPLQRGRVLTNDQIYMEHASVGHVQVGGPFKVLGPTKDTPSRRAVFVCEPPASATAAQERACATQILSRLARLAYRRPSTSADVTTLLSFFDQGRAAGGSFETGIQFALERLLVDPDFLLRVYRTPAAAAATNTPYRLSDLEVASRLSFFLWSSVPDEPLLDLAERGQLTQPATLERQVRRMLADPRARRGLVDDFAAQWLNLRRVGEVVVHPDFYPNFDESLLEAFKTETEMFVTSTLQEDRSVRDLLAADYTFVNERLARHYGIPGITGSRFRRVTLADSTKRGGLLAHGSILATTSYPERTSPVLRGKWLLDNIFGTPPPPPPPGVDTNLPEVRGGIVPPTIRERLAQHRQNVVCSSCHSTIDPPGFALEHFDAIGGWRATDEAGRPVDAVGSLPNGKTIEGLAGLRALLLEDPDRFPRTMTEKLMAYALGRRLENFDRPAVRQIVRNAATQNYRWSSIILGIVQSPAFLMRAGESG